MISIRPPGIIGRSFANTKRAKLVIYIANGSLITTRPIYEKSLSLLLRYLVWYVLNRYVRIIPEVGLSYH